MDKKVKVLNCRIVSYKPVFLNSHESDFYIRKLELERNGFTSQLVQDENAIPGTQTFIFTHANSILAQIEDDVGRVFNDVDIRNVIAYHYSLTRVSEKKIKSFMNDVNSGKINFVLDTNSNTFILR